MNPSAAYAALLSRTRDHHLLGTCAGVLEWDERTYLPEQGHAHRAEQLALLARLGHEMFTAPAVGELLAAVEASDLTREPYSDTAANVREIRRLYDRAVRMPKSLVEELARVGTQAQHAWVSARKHNDFAEFRPWLEKIVGLKRQQAEAIGYRECPYDALLDEYEPGATTASLTELFAALRAELTPLVGRIAASGRRPRRELLERDYPVDQQREFGMAAATAIGFDFTAGRLDVTTHPFCSGHGPGDCRITTRYNPRHFSEAFFGTLHEAGHGMYEQGLAAEHFGQPLGTSASLGIHESQSRLWENQVGRSAAFWEFFFPRARATFPNALADVELDAFVFAINDVRPSFIRVEADEATYNLHIILRFELEQALISGDLAPADVPVAWNEKFQQSFGLDVPDAARGCLQDIHWSAGGIGYFPTYTLGNLYAAQFMQTARRELGDLDDDFRRGEFGRLKGWLNRQVHQPGRRWPAETLCERITGDRLRHQPLLDYLHAKYKPLFGL